MNNVLDFANNCFEILSIYFVLVILDRANRFPIIKLVVFVGCIAAISAFINILNLPYHLIFTIAFLILLGGLLKKRKLTNLMADTICACIIISLIQLFAIAVIGYFCPSGIDSPYTTMLTGIIAVIIWLLSKIRKICKFFELYCQPNRHIVVLCMASLVLLFVIVTNVWDDQNGMFHQEEGWLLLLTVGYFLVNLLLLISLIKIRRETSRNRLLEEYGDYSDRVITELRKKAHDYNSHLNAILALAEMKPVIRKDKAIIDYIEAVVSEGKLRNSISLLSKNRMISAYLIHISKIAETMGVALRYDIASPAPEYLIPEYDLITILSNLANNAIEAVEKFSSKEKWVSLKFEKDCIEIKNHGYQDLGKPTIDKLKEQGFSTKGPERGYGLASAFDIAEKNGITLETYLVQGDIVFELRFPGKKA
jgi:hypothetical protein